MDAVWVSFKKLTLLGMFKWRTILKGSINPSIFDSFLLQGGFPLSRNFYVITHVTLTSTNKIEAMHEMSNVRAKVLNITLKLNTIYFLYFKYELKIYVRVHACIPFATRSRTGIKESVSRSRLFLNLATGPWGWFRRWFNLRPRGVFTERETSHWTDC